MLAPPSPSEPFFEPEWLDRLHESLAPLARSSPRFEDLYLERRLEVRCGVVGEDLLFEHLDGDGAAARWHFPSRTVLTAGTGTSAASLARLLGRWGPRPPAVPTRHAVSVPLDPPAGWRTWVEELPSLLAARPLSAVLLRRHAVVVRPDGWRQVTSPPLVRIRVGDAGAALLAVWGHPQLPVWLRALAEPVRGRGWRPPSGERLPVLFTSGAGGTLVHELMGHLLEADAGVTTSPLWGLHGATVTATTLDVRDDPTRLDLPGGFSCDDEGVPARPRPLVSSGVVAGWLADRSGASALGLQPGRGRRPSWRHPPSPRLSNLVTSPGREPPAALERDLGRGLVVTRVAGATVDPVTARTLIRVERGWEVRHGRRRRPLAHCELTGSALEVLTGIDPSLGDDPVADWRLGWCVKDGLPLPTGTETPSLLVRSLEVL